MLNHIARIVLSLAFALPVTVFAHGGKTHVMGVVEKVEGRNLTVKDTKGKSVPIKLTSDTLYFVGGLKASRDELTVGPRIAVDVFGMKGDYSALEIQLGVEKPVAAGELGEVWTCSMHPEIRASEPGRCSICKMHLVRAEADAKPADAEQASEVWTCSMHPEIRESNPGSCSICKMHLVRAEVDTKPADAGRADGGHEEHQH